MKLLKQTMKHIKENKLLFILSSFLDLIYIVTFFIVFAAIMQAIFPVLLQLSNITHNFNTFAPDLDNLASNALTGSTEFLALYTILRKWLSILALSLFGIWTIQALNFFISSKIIDKKTKITYISKFVVISLIYYILIILSFWLTAYLSMANSRLIIPLFTQGIINIILISLLIIICYLSSISIANIRKRNVVEALKHTFKIVFRKKTFLTFLMLLIVVIIGAITFAFFKINIILFYILTLFLFIPSISFVRILFLTEIK